jgi:hypothetical protein
MRRGIYRNELSLHAKSGGCCVEVKSDQLNNFDPGIEAKPEVILNGLIRGLTEEERNTYYERVSQLITVTLIHHQKIKKSHFGVNSVAKLQ